MDDIIQQGADREPSRPRRRLAVILVLVVVAVLLLVRHLPHGHHASAGHNGVPVTATTGPNPACPPQAVCAGSYNTAVRDNEPGGTAIAFIAAGGGAQPDGITGPTLPWPGSLRIPVAGDQPFWLWPRTGRTEPIGGLPRSQSGYAFTRVDGGWAVQPTAPFSSGCGACVGIPRPVYYVGYEAPSAIAIGAANGVAPGAAMGSMWLTSYPSQADTATAAGTAQEVSSLGVPIGPGVTLPAGGVIAQATSAGLLLERGQITTEELWDPKTGRVSQVFSGVIASNAAAIAWAPLCTAACVVDVLRFATGRVSVIRLPARSSATTGAFSPDGRLLALQVSFSDGGNSGDLAMQLEVASVLTGHLVVVRGTWASNDALAGFGWPTPGDNLVTKFGFTTKVELASWTPGSRYPAVAMVSPDQDPTSLVVG